MQTEKFLSTPAIKRLFKDIEDSKISAKACLEMQKYLQEYSKIIGKLAVKNARYEGRKYVKDKDIKEAIKEIEQSKKSFIGN